VNSLDFVLSSEFSGSLVPFVTSPGIASADINWSVHVLSSTFLIVSASFWKSENLIKSVLLAESSSGFPSFRVAVSQFEHTLLELTSALAQSSESVVSLPLDSTACFVRSDSIVLSRPCGFSENTGVSQVLKLSNTAPPSSILGGSANCHRSITFSASYVFDASEPFLSTWLLSQTSLFPESDGLIISEGQDETQKRSAGAAIVGIGIGLLAAVSIFLALLWHKHQRNQNDNLVYDVDAEFQEEGQETDSDQDTMDLDAVHLDVNESHFSADADEGTFGLPA
jgi:hypothetical protein